MSYEENTNKWLAGRTIKNADVDGHGILLEFEDGSILDYKSSDGGYSCWSMCGVDQTKTDEGNNGKL